MPPLTTTTILTGTSLVAGAAFLAALRRAQNLEAEIEKLRSSLAVGLAEGYHSNFLKWVARDVARGQPLVEKGAPSACRPSRLFVLLPRRLDWESGDAIARYLAQLKASGRAVDVHFGDAAPRFRPQIIKRATDAAVQNVLFDVPTTLQAIHHNLRDEEPGERDGRFAEEVERFKEHLDSRLRQTAGHTAAVQVVEIDDLQTLMDSLSVIVAQLQTP